MSLIKLSNIKKSFRDGENQLNNVLRGINMEIGKGEFVAIKGASGSGKTTLLSILGTLLQPDGGSYLLDEAEMTTAGVDHSLVRNKQLGFVFQDHRLMPQYTVLENILLPALAYASRTGKEETEYAHRLLELTHISGVAHQYPSTLSGGASSEARIEKSTGLL